MLLDEIDAVLLDVIVPEGVGPHERVCPDCNLITNKHLKCGASYGCSEDYVPTFTGG